jgi:hypothetical protein
VLAVPGRARADEECFRLGVEAWRSVLEWAKDIDLFSVVGERALGPVAVRARLGHGVDEDTGDIVPGNPSGDADLWSVTIGVEGRAAVSRDGSIAGFAGIGLGVLHLSGGYVDDAQVHGQVFLQIGLDLRTAWLRTRPSVGLLMRIDTREGASSRLGALPGVGIGFEIAR